MQEQHNTKGGVHGFTHPTSSSPAWEPLKPKGSVYIFGPIYSFVFWDDYQTPNLSMVLFYLTAFYIPEILSLASFSEAKIYLDINNPELVHRQFIFLHSLIARNACFYYYNRSEKPDNSLF